MGTADRFLPLDEGWTSWIPQPSAELTPYLATVLVATVLLYSWPSVDATYKALPAVNESWGGIFSVLAKVC
jgi:hypothetical protein